MDRTEITWRADQIRRKTLGTGYWRRIVQVSRHHTGGPENSQTPLSSPQTVTHSDLLALVLARFYGRKTSLRLESANTETLMRRLGTIGRAVLRLADRIVVPTYRMAHKLAAYDISAVVEERPVNVQAVVTRSITEVQPRLLVYSSSDWPQDLPLVVEAFEQIQQKYPRAELTLAGPDRSLRDLMVNRILRGRLHVHQPCDSAEFAHLCGSHDIFLATASSDLTPDQLVVAMAAGLPAIFPPTGDIRPANELALLRTATERRFVRRRIVETVLSLVENRAMVAPMCRYSQRVRRGHAGGIGSSTGRPPWRLTG